MSQNPVAVDVTVHYDNKECLQALCKVFEFIDEQAEAARELDRPLGSDLQGAVDAVAVARRTIAVDAKDHHRHSVRFGK